MRFKSYLILLLMLMVAAAPVVDATICKDCNDETLFSAISQRDHATASEISAKSGADSQRTQSAQDLCPFCSHSAAAMISLACGAPTTISHTYHLPKLLTLSNLSKSITKPPQN